MAGHGLEDLDLNAIWVCEKAKNSQILKTKRNVVMMSILNCSVYDRSARYEL